MDEEFQRWAAAVHRALESLEESSYYQVLGVAADAPQELIRKAFHRRAVQLHPDRHRETPEPARGDVYALFKRMTEAYRVLLDPDLRRIYDASLAAGNLRLTDEWASAGRPKSRDELLKTPGGQRHYRAAMDALGAGDLQGAELNFKLALSHEGDVPFLQELLVDVKSRRAARPVKQPTAPPPDDGAAAAPAAPPTPPAPADPGLAAAVVAPAPAAAAPAPAAAAPAAPAPEVPSDLRATPVMGTASQAPARDDDAGKSPSGRS
jgi:DnaJ-domain-containing protein 1